MHLDNYPDIFPKDDRLRNRILARQFYWLAQFDLETASRISWAQWSYIVDNIYLTSINEFPKWFADVMNNNDYDFSAGFVRLWMEMLNIIFKKRRVDLSDWTWEELERPLHATLQILDKVQSTIDLNDGAKRRILRICISETLGKNRKEYLLFLDKQIDHESFVNLITSNSL